MQFKKRLSWPTNAISSVSCSSLILWNHCIVYIHSIWKNTTHQNNEAIILFSSYCFNIFGKIVWNSDILLCYPYKYDYSCLFFSWRMTDHLFQMNILICVTKKYFLAKMIFPTTMMKIKSISLLKTDKLYEICQIDKDSQGTEERKLNCPISSESRSSNLWSSPCKKAFTYIFFSYVHKNNVYNIGSTEYLWMLHTYCASRPSLVLYC